MKNSLVIFTHDLRLTNQSVIDYLDAEKMSYVPVHLDFLELIPAHNFFTVNVLRRKFNLQATQYLAKALYAKDKELLIINKNFKEALLEVMVKNGCTQVCLSRNTIKPLTDLLQSMELMLLKNNIFIKYFDSNYLIDLDDMPFPLSRMPKDFKIFVNKIKGVRFNSVCDGEIVPEGVLKVLDDIQQEEEPELLPYKTRLNNHFSKFLPYLTSGLISPAKLLEVVVQRSGTSPYFDKKAVKVLTNQLMKLDFIRAQMRNSQHDAFVQTDITSEQINSIEQWIQGQTDYPLINAIMHKLQTMSMISLTSKKLAILYYLKVLKLPMYFGFYYFENQLLEYDNSLNQYLWLEYAGMDLDIEGFENLVSAQQKHLDPKDSFLEYWNE